MSEFHYKAFISYSHVDESWARWLHRALESYRVPRKLVGTETATGKVPARIMPVFRDRDELPSAADLSATVKSALAASENLIVVCSPNAAASHWVKEEIREFTRLGRRDRIFCLIIDGEADAGGSIAAVFPDAIAEAGLDEPLAADARKWADGKVLARLKLVAGMLGLPLDQLRRRELQKRRKLATLAAAAALVLIAIILIAIRAQMAADQRRASGETLVALKLNELRTLLTQAREPEDLDRLQAWDKPELEALLAAAGPGPEDWVKAAQHLRDEGIELWDDGDLSSAMSRFNQSWALLAEVYHSDRRNQDILFQLGQAEYWIGQVHVDRGELDLAEAAFLTYAEITRRLIQLQPENAEWVLEMAYALTNLGEVQSARNGINPERTLQYMQSALEYNQIALVLDPENLGYRSELGQSYAFLADAQRGVCDLEGALDSRRKGVEIETGLVNENSPNKEMLAFALTGYAQVQAAHGLHNEARDNYLRAVELIRKSNPADPGARTARLVAERENHIIWLDAVTGRNDEAWERSTDLFPTWQKLATEAGLDNLNTLIAYAQYLLNRAVLANERGQHDEAQALLQEGQDRIVAEARLRPGNRDLGNALTHAAWRYFQINASPPPADVLALLPDYRANQDRTRACVDASLAVRKAVLLENPAEASDLVAYLLAQGYRESGFMHVCEKYYSCSGQ